MIRTARHLSWIGLLLALGVLAAAPLHGQGTYAYSTYLGGSLDDAGEAIATSPSGNVYIAVTTRSWDFLQLSQPPAQPVSDPWAPRRLFVVALDPAGHVIYSTPVFSVPYDHYVTVAGIAVAPDGTATLAGTYVDGDDEYYFAYYAQISPSGNLSRFGYLGGLWTWAQGVAVDSSGSIYVTGHLYDDGYRAPYMPGSWAFLTKVGSYFTRFTLAGSDNSRFVAVDSSGRAVIGGMTTNVYGSGDVFLGWFDSSGSMTRSKILGGRNNDEPTAMTLTPGGDVVITGVTGSPDFPLVQARQAELKGGADLFLSRVSSRGDLLASTYLGSSSSRDEPLALASGQDGSLYLLSMIQPYAPDDGAWKDSPLLSDTSGCRGSLLARLDPEDFRILQTGCIPRSWGRALAVDPQGWISVTGDSGEGFPLINPAQSFYAGNDDAFAARLLLNRPPDCSKTAALPSTIWPPNGRLTSVLLVGVTDPDGDPVTLSVTGIRQDEPRSAEGDASGIGTSQPWVRAQRAGNGDGRVYRIAFQARDDQGGVCAGEVKVCVPHDAARTACGDGGGLVDSTR